MYSTEARAQLKQLSTLLAIEFFRVDVSYTPLYNFSAAWPGLDV